VGRQQEVQAHVLLVNIYSAEADDEGHILWNNEKGISCRGSRCVASHSEVKWYALF